jgi:hypothetical protein
MRIHANTLTTSDIYQAARFARVDVVVLTEHGSRKRDHAFNVRLEGASNRRPNFVNYDSGYGSGYSATWDQWGVFLSVLFDLDPSTSTTYDEDRHAFDVRTVERFWPSGIVGIGVSTNANIVNVRDSFGVVHRNADHYWPADAHGDHTFKYAGVPRSQSCTKCSAVQTWS